MACWHFGGTDGPVCCRALEEGHLEDLAGADAGGKAAEVHQSRGVAVREICVVLRGLDGVGGNETTSLQ